MRYKITKIGLLNFWLYDEEEFEFSDGKLLLRGSNGSGKSVTMQSFIPLILDGNKTPARLDPFGSKDKKIEDYLLGGVDSVQKDESTGYLYMEVYQEDKEKYITIGMGLHARRGRPTDFWGFALQDGRRIGKDMFLYHNKVDKVLLTKNELRVRLGTENILVESQKEYKKMVNQLLFGFSNLDSYDEFINVLLQLRSPKLSKEYKPTKLMDILSGVLQPLTEDDLRPLSEAIEEMDKTKEKIEKLESDVKQLSYLSKAYNNYNETILYQKTERYLESLKETEKIESQEKELIELIQKEENSLKENEKIVQDLELEKASINQKKANMDLSDLESKTNRLQELNKDIIDYENKKEEQQKRLSEKIEKQKNLQKEQKELVETEYKIEKLFTEVYKEIEEYSEELKFSEIILMLKDLQKDKTTKIDFTYLKNRLFQYQNRIKQIKEKLLLQKQKEEKRNEHQLRHEQLEKNYQELNDSINCKEEEILKELREIKDQILFLSKNNQILKMTQEEYNNIISSLHDNQIESFSTAKNKYNQLAENLKRSITDEFYRIKEKKNRKEEDIKKIETLLEELKNKKEEEILLDEEEKETLSFLEESNIPYIHFYKAVEFKENLSTLQKNKIEALLLSSGILSSIIISDTNKETLRGHKGSYLFASSKKNNNLTEYLTVSPSISETYISPSEVTKVLESISINPNDLYCITTDYYQMDFITGFASNKTEAKYIGAFLREQEHQRKIKEQEEILTAEKAIYQNLESLLEEKNVEISLLTQEKDKFPKEDTLVLLSNEKNNLSIQMNLINQEQLKEEKEIRNLSKDLEELFRTLNELKQDILLPLYLETFEEALQTIDYLKTSLLELEKVLVRYQSVLELKETKKEQLIELEIVLDEINGDFGKTQLELRKKKIEKQDLEEILNTDAYRNLSQNLLEMKIRLDEIDKQLSELNQKHGRSENLLEFKKQEKLNLNEKKTQQELMLKLCEKFFIKEYELHYVMDDKIENSKTTAKKVLEKLHTRKDSDIENVKNNYYAAYNEYRLKLNDYHLSNINLFQEEEFEEAKENSEIRNLIQENRRVDMTAMYQGRKLNIYMLTTALQDAIIENDQIISDQDRHLFEEILLKTIGTKIRDKIADSKEWVAKMNAIMKTMQKDSALSFQLEWRNKEAESMDELETKELVRIFQIPADALKKEDNEKLIRHFRSKLKRYLEQNAESYVTYANVIFEVLDYRTWFEFKMTYQRIGENKKELTDKVFSVFSGGEKAKTMYIPLFAAVYAKLMSARKNALRVVALDEAFAGVDDANIREMFGIMASLDLDYILTSQALWGDYDAISDLAISELLRPNNSSAVAIRRYHWNGKVKEVVLPKETEDVIGIF